MSAYIAKLRAESDRAKAKRDAERAEKAAAEIEAARERMTPVRERVAKVLKTIPVELQREGLSLPVLQASLRGRWRGNVHPGELGKALRQLGFERHRGWHGKNVGFRATWRLTA